MPKKFKMKNYTSSVSVSKSIAEIEELLSSAGANMILKEYDVDHNVVGFTFSMQVDDKPAIFKLPANTHDFAEAMLAEKKKLHKGTRVLVTEQAERTAWKVLHEWVAIQLTMIRVHNVHPFQVFMGYLYDTKRKQNLFQRLQEEGLPKLLAATSQSSVEHPKDP